MIWVELLLLLTCILIGSRLGGIGMGTMGGLGLFIFTFVFHLPPGGPPVTVLFMILAVITALSSMEAVGGLTYLVNIAEKVMRKNPKSITFVAPFVTYALIFMSGTQHVIYALLPVIAEISRKSGIRPERPLSISVIAATAGLIASPISAATVALVGTLAGRQVELSDVMVIIIPSTLLAVLIGAFVVSKRGVDLKDDPTYQKLLSEEKFKDIEGAEVLSGQALKQARGSTFTFFAGVLFVVIIGLFPQLRPEYQEVVNGELVTKQVAMAEAIMIIMLAIAAVIMLAFKAKPQQAVTGSIMRSGIVAVLSILGISWLGSSFFEGNETVIVSEISQLIEGQEWLFALGLFALSVLLFSQAATVVTLVPVAVALGIPTPLIIALYPAVNGIFFLPTYGTILAAVSFDQTKTTHIGKYLLNHSFMLPGLVVTISATAIALLINQILN
ncbi:anaerobic C4-dicarboxylate transporter family protein [Rubritalea tangerina]|uniref:Anaerobic C4-dicarboxylate transporter family protein n=1 Tax=Rubritalea tangerina TaxID=430798 RepID=A0ABW4Z7H5_9BACT